MRTLRSAEAESSLMRDDVVSLVRDRAEVRCEYCRLSELDFPAISHQIERIFPKKHGGADNLENLALACGAGNFYKGSNISGFDPERGELTRLYHPRQDVWDEHFAIEERKIVGLTAVGQSTVVVLRLNDEVHLRLRIAARW